MYIHVYLCILSCIPVHVYTMHTYPMYTCLYPSIPYIPMYTCMYTHDLYTQVTIPLHTPIPVVLMYYIYSCIATYVYSSISKPHLYYTHVYLIYTQVQLLIDVYSGMPVCTHLQTRLLYGPCMPHVYLCPMFTQGYCEFNACSALYYFHVRILCIPTTIQAVNN